ncbi:hypothetical protein [Ectopseudomonas oleovorans]|uniref:hypothetical protein n=1 Tax=Ectopseudomonas oleovorans TaxID=301 RepID=UPI003C7C61E3
MRNDKRHKRPSIALMWKRHAKAVGGARKQAMKVYPLIMGDQSKLSGKVNATADTAPLRPVLILTAQFT